MIGETAAVGDGVTLLHGVTLGGTGKEVGDRHPKVGKNVLIGANASLLGNITIGKASKIGAGSVVLRDIPAGATAVGVPARIIGHSREAKPGSDMDEALRHVSLLHKSPSMTSTQTSRTAPLTEDEEEDSSQAGDDAMRTLALSENVPPQDEKAPTTKEPSKTVPNATESDADEYDEAPADGVLLCPYRDYQRLSKLVPPHAVSYNMLHAMLATVGQEDKAGSIMFALDTRDVGHLLRADFGKNGRVVQVMAEHTQLDEEAIQDLIQSYFASPPPYSSGWDSQRM